MEELGVVRIREERSKHSGAGEQAVAGVGGQVQHGRQAGRLVLTLAVFLALQVKRQ